MYKANNAFKYIIQYYSDRRVQSDTAIWNYCIFYNAIGRQCLKVLQY